MDIENWIMNEIELKIKHKSKLLKREKNISIPFYHNVVGSSLLIFNPKMVNSDGSVINENISKDKLMDVTIGVTDKTEKVEDVWG